jgi:integrase
MINEFAHALKLSDLSENTIKSYCNAVESFQRQYGELTKRNLLSYKGWLVENYKAKTVNLRLQALNRYLDFIKKPNLKMKSIKVQQQNFLENVISDADYRFFCRKLKADNRLNWYFVVRYLCATGARISELLQIKVEHVEVGYLDLYGKVENCADSTFQEDLKARLKDGLRKWGFQAAIFSVIVLASASQHEA